MTGFPSTGSVALQAIERLVHPDTSEESVGMGMLVGGVEGVSECGGGGLTVHGRAALYVQFK